MNLKGLTKAEFFAPPIVGINPIPIDPATGDLIYPEFLTEAQRKEIEKFVKATFPAAKPSVKPPSKQGS